MKARVLIVLLLIGALPALAQSLSPEKVVTVRSAAELALPCTGTVWAKHATTGAEYQCVAGTWSCVGGGGSVTGADEVLINSDGDNDGIAKVSIVPVTRDEGRLIHVDGDLANPAFPYPWKQFEIWRPGSTASHPNFAFAVTPMDLSACPRPTCGGADGESENEGAWPVGDTASTLRIMADAEHQAGAYAAVNLELWPTETTGCNGPCITSGTTVQMVGGQTYNGNAKFALRFRSDMDGDGTFSDEATDFGDRAGTVNATDDLFGPYFATMVLVPNYDTTISPVGDNPAIPGSYNDAHFEINFKDRSQVDQYDQLNVFPDWNTCSTHNSLLRILVKDNKRPGSAGGGCLGALLFGDVDQTIAATRTWAFDGMWAQGGGTGLRVKDIDLGYSQIVQVGSDYVYGRILGGYNHGDVDANGTLDSYAWTGATDAAGGWSTGWHFKTVADDNYDYTLDKFHSVDIDGREGLVNSSFLKQTGIGPLGGIRLTADGAFNGSGEARVYAKVIGTTLEWVIDFDDDGTIDGATFEQGFTATGFDDDVDGTAELYWLSNAERADPDDDGTVDVEVSNAGVSIYNAAGTFATTVTSSPTANRTVTIQDAGPQTLVARDTTDTLSNKTLDVSNNVVRTVEKIWFDAASCNDGTSARVGEMHVGAATGPTPACRVGTNYAFGTLDFDATTQETAYAHLPLSSDWYSTTNLDVRVFWTANDTGTNAVVWNVSTSCAADNEAEQAYNTGSSVTDAYGGTTAFKTMIASAANVSKANCAASEWMVLRVYRDAANAADTLAVDAKLIGVEVTLGRAQ